jgi:hypothetical protein
VIFPAGADMVVTSDKSLLSRGRTLLLETPLILEIAGLILGIFLPGLFNFAVAKISGAEPAHHELFADFLSGLFFAICFHTLKESYKSHKRVNELTGSIEKLITTSIDKNLTKDIDASIIKVLGRGPNDDPLLGKLQVDVIHEYLDFVHRLDKNTQSIIAALTLIHICDFLKKLSDDSEAGVLLTHKQQCDISAMLTEGRKTYKQYELGVGKDPDTWNKTYLQFINSISTRRDIDKEYTIIEDEKQLTEQKFLTLRAYREFYKQRGFAVYFCQKSQVMTALNKISFQYNLVELYGNVGCFTHIPDLDYGNAKELVCRYLDTENSQLEKNLVRLVVNFREPLETVLRRQRSRFLKPLANLFPTDKFS